MQTAAKEKSLDSDSCISFGNNDYSLSVKLFTVFIADNDDIEGVDLFLPVGKMIHL
jgi:hypothetical protein